MTEQAPTQPARRLAGDRRRWRSRQRSRRSRRRPRWRSPEALAIQMAQGNDPALSAKTKQSQTGRQHDDGEPVDGDAIDRERVGRRRVERRPVGEPVDGRHPDQQQPGDVLSRDGDDPHVMSELERRLELFGTEVRILVAPRDHAGRAPGGAAVSPPAPPADAVRSRQRAEPAQRRPTRGRAGLQRSWRPRCAPRSQAAELTGGLVDPTLLGPLERAGYATSRMGVEPADLREAVRTAPARRPALPRGGPGWRRAGAGRRLGSPPAGPALRSRWQRQGPRRRQRGGPAA